MHKVDLFLNQTNGKKVVSSSWTCPNIDLGLFNVKIEVRTIIKIHNDCVNYRSEWYLLLPPLLHNPHVRYQLGRKWEMNQDSEYAQRTRMRQGRRRRKREKEREEREWLYIPQ